MNTNLYDFIKKLISEHDTDVLNDSKKVNAYLSDLAAKEPKPQRMAFVKCLMYGFYTELQKTNVEDRQRCKNRLAQKLFDDEGLDMTLSKDTLDLLEALLFGTVMTAESSQPRPIPEVMSVPNEPIAPIWEMSSSPSIQQPIMATNIQPQHLPHNKHTVRKVILLTAIVAIIFGILTWQNSVPEGFVRIKGGTFMIGSPASEVDSSDDEAQHWVTVSSFHMRQYEVTQREYELAIGNNPSYFKGANLPVECVSWFDAVAYCNARSQREGLTLAYTVAGENVTRNRNANGYRLPTEAEWEYACRAGTTGPFSTGNNITTSQANYDGNHPYNNNAKGTFREKTTNVGSFLSNPWGLYDMHGNVVEWCWDWYGGYNMADQTDPVGVSSGRERVIRGGGADGNANAQRSAYRYAYTPSYRHDAAFGFRVCRSIL
ncbi:hypothetical protein FACS1894106_0210 [Spirochaetia bacterium]|nr:hypothetical protein FACS1894106_0210 [Spirochaetia bacterium]